MLVKLVFSKPDYLVPQLILLYLPRGLRALIFVSLLSAAMSSLDSALNSLSASTVNDFIGPRLKDQSRLLLTGKLTTVGWGIIITGVAFLVGGISDTVIESINKIGSAFYGPILAAFIVGVLSRRATAKGVMAGILARVGFNLFLWVFMPGVHWMWWNFFGFMVAVIVSFCISRFRPRPTAETISRYVLRGHRLLGEEYRWLPIYAVLVLYFIFMLTLLSLI